MNAKSPPAGWTRKKTRLATSTDKGLTWHLEGDILTDCLPDKGDWLRFSGSYFEAGPAILISMPTTAEGILHLLVQFLRAKEREDEQLSLVQ